jgi:hypothetical protein
MRQSSGQGLGHTDSGQIFWGGNNLHGARSRRRLNGKIVGSLTLFERNLAERIDLVASIVMELRTRK